MMVSDRSTGQTVIYLTNSSQQFFKYELNNQCLFKVKEYLGFLWGKFFKTMYQPTIKALKGSLKIVSILLNYQKMYSAVEEDISKEQLLSKVQQLIKRNNQSDLFNKAFLKPIEIALKTFHTDPNEPGKAYDSLPFGLKHAIKADISLNKFVLADFKSYEELNMKNKSQSEDYQYLLEHNYDNLLSLLKRNDGNGLQIAICVCMYSEDKTMLRRTLSGITNNIVNFAKHGLNPDKIGVFVIMDGIQVVDETVVHFFQQMQKESSIYLDDTVEPVGEHDLIKTDINELEKQEIKNINEFVFTDEQLTDRKKRRFYERKTEYGRIKQMIKRIQVLQMDKKITYETLDESIKPYFIDKAREQYKIDNNADDFQMKKITPEKLQQLYAYNITVSRPLISAALNQAKIFCQQYIETRDDLALMNIFRPEIEITPSNNDEENKEEEQNQKQFLMKDEITTIKMNLFMLTKYKNAGKLSSHNWFFNGFCKELLPTYAVLLDVGLSPQPDALVKMYNYMLNKPTVGGVCGYMGLRIQRLEDQDEVNPQHIDWLSSICLKCVDIQRAQQLQYHFSHLVDKPFQSIFEFIHVLPGAYSAYRMQALQPDVKQDSHLLKQYFKSLDSSSNPDLLQKSEFGNFQVCCKALLPDFIYECCYGPPPQNSEERLLYDSNVYLAEDRTLCMGIHQNGYDLQYLPDAYAWVDPIKNLHGLLGQRKRWINGSFFAFDKVKSTLESTQSSAVCLRLQMLFLTLMNMISYVAPALFFFTIHLAMYAFRNDVLGQISIFGGRGFFWDAFVYTIDFIYIINFFGLVFFSMHLTSKNTRFMPYIYIASTLFGIFSICIFIVLTYDLVKFFIELGKNDGNISFLINQYENQAFKREAKLIQDLVPILYYLIIGIFALYSFPIIVYPIIYQRCSFIEDIVFSTVSFLFYSPTYLNILSVYALCRIDDISWGTKGLDTEVGKKKMGLQNSWKKIKYIHVFKFIFWNILAAAIMLSIGGGQDAKSYRPRFYLTLAIMLLLAFTLFMKVFLGTIYMFRYRCGKKQYIKKYDPVEQKGVKIDRCFDRVKKLVYQDIEYNISEIQKNYKKEKVPLKSLIMKKSKFKNILNKSRGNKKMKKLFKNQSRIVNEELKFKRKAPIIGKNPEPKVPKENQVKVNLDDLMQKQKFDSKDKNEKKNTSLEKLFKKQEKKEEKKQTANLSDMFKKEDKKKSDSESQNLNDLFTKKNDKKKKEDEKFSQDKLQSLQSQKVLIIDEVDEGEEESAVKKEKSKKFQRSKGVFNKKNDK